eukprot:TRINITY_DN17522_c0_g3_i1.p2 TRINITY_DN17522_c0_g3~~TRINITY_DN17522_c0_g3_i1.p2  ORF type:complete len:124 (+),score=2.52 TRINITY_DN17522_c0_g3_i1:171-542(+)
MVGLLQVSSQFPAGSAQFGTPSLAVIGPSTRADSAAMPLSLPGPTAGTIAAAVAASGTPTAVPTALVVVAVACVVTVDSETCGGEAGGESFLSGTVYVPSLSAFTTRCSVKAMASKGGRMRGS